MSDPISDWGDRLRGEPEPDVDCCPECDAIGGGHRRGCEQETAEERAEREAYESDERVDATLAWREL